MSTKGSSSLRGRGFSTGTKSAIVSKVSCRAVSFGAFVEVGDGVEGLLHASVWRSRPEMGSVIEVELAAVDAVNRRLSLVQP